MEETPTPEPSALSVRLVSRTPGRIRLRILKPHRQPHQIDRIVNVLEMHPQVTKLRLNEQTGSMTIFHELDDDSLESAFAQLQSFNVNVIVDGQPNGTSAMATGVMQAAGSLNKRVKKTTGGTADLRAILPAALAAIALRQLFAGSKHLRSAPWYVLAWYAFDSFIKLNTDAKATSEASKRAAGNGHLAQLPEADGGVSSPTDQETTVAADDNGSDGS